MSSLEVRPSASLQGLGPQTKATKVAAGAPDRRPIGFWGTFNDWWRAELGRLGRRPSTAEIKTWYEENAAALWKDDLPSLQETRTHAKCLRSLPLVREYFRHYRSKRRAAAEGNERSPADLPAADSRPVAVPGPPLAVQTRPQGQAAGAPLSSERQPFETEPHTARSPHPQRHTAGPMRTSASGSQSTEEPSGATASASHPSARDASPARRNHTDASSSLQYELVGMPNMSTMSTLPTSLPMVHPTVLWGLNGMTSAVGPSLQDHLLHKLAWQQAAAAMQPQQLTFMLAPHLMVSHSRQLQVLSTAPLLGHEDPDSHRTRAEAEGFERPLAAPVAQQGPRSYGSGAGRVVKEEVEVPCGREAQLHALTRGQLVAQVLQLEAALESKDELLHCCMAELQSLRARLAAILS